MSHFDDIMLVSLLETKDDETSITDRDDAKVHFFTGKTHIEKRIMRFIGVATSLKVFVPDFETLIVGARDEFTFTELCQTHYISLMTSLISEFFFHHNNIVGDRKLFEL